MQHSATVLVLSTVAVILIHQLLHRWRRHSITYLQGPWSGSWLLGNLPQVYRPEIVFQHERKWVEEYGKVFPLKGAFGEDILYVVDPKALQYIMNTSGYNFCKPKQNRATTSIIAGKGLSWADGEDHARQRRIMTPAFHFSTLRNFLPQFRSVVQKMTMKWNDLLQEMGGKGVLEMTSWLSKTTLDAMGETVFEYNFDSLDEGHRELTQVYSNLISDSFFKRSNRTIIFEALWGYMPWWLITMVQNLLPTRQLKRLRDCNKVARKVARHIVETASNSHDPEKEGAKDIMSILIRANMSEDPKVKLSDETLMAQMTTFMFAGHDTTATTMSWALYELSQNKEAQKILREEIREIKRSVIARGDVDLTIQDIDSMKYLAAVMKETLRYRSIVHLIQREATKDDIIPLSTPLKSKNGEIITSIPVSKGQRCFLGVSVYNLLKSVWGEDADQWRPERFLENDKNSSRAKISLGVTSNLGTFAGGVRGCIGWRFALTEMQTLLIELIDKFEYEPAPGNPEIIPATPHIISPMVKGKEGRSQLPLLISPAF